MPSEELMIISMFVGMRRMYLTAATKPSVRGLHGG